MIPKHVWIFYVGTYSFFLTFFVLSFNFICTCWVCGQQKFCHAKKTKDNILGFFFLAFCLGIPFFGMRRRVVHWPLTTVGGHIIRKHCLRSHYKARCGTSFGQMFIEIDIVNINIIRRRALLYPHTLNKSLYTH